MKSFTLLMKNTSVSMLVLVLLLFSTISLSSFVDQYNFECQLLSHLKLLWAGIIALLTVGLLATKRPRWCLFGATVLAINFVSVGGLWIPQIGSGEWISTGAESRATGIPSNSNDKKQKEKTVRILISNLWGDHNKDYERTCLLVHRLAPDMVGLSEVTPDWLNALRNNLPGYKYVIAEPRYGGIALFSKFPFKKGAVKHYGLNPRIEAVVHCEINNDTTENESVKDALVICMHPSVPMTPEQLRLRNGELDEVAKSVVSTKMPVIVFGDMNCTPFSSYFQKFMKDSGLVDTEKGFGVQPTWNALMPLPVIPIDHCFTSREFRTRRRYLTNRTGSDHLPVFVELVREKRD